MRYLIDEHRTVIVCGLMLLTALGFLLLLMAVVRLPLRRPPGRHAQKTRVPLPARGTEGWLEADDDLEVSAEVTHFDLTVPLTEMEDDHPLVRDHNPETRPLPPVPASPQDHIGEEIDQWLLRGK